MLPTMSEQIVLVTGAKGGLGRSVTTAFLDTGRNLIAGDAAAIGLAFGLVLGLIALFSLWAWRSLRSAEAAGG